MRMRRTAVAVALAAAVTVPAVSTAVAAFAQPTSAAAHSKPAKPAKPAKKNFSASGTVTAVSAADGHVTVAAKGGTKDAKGHTITVTVPSNVRIVVNGSRKTLADVGVGYQITVIGTHAGTVYTATKVEAKGTKVRPKPTATPIKTPTKTPTPSTSPTAGHDPSDDDPTTEPSEDPSDDPNDDPTPAPSDDPGDD
jgi:hypothetical protein